MATPLSKNLIDEVLSYTYEHAYDIMWFLVESSRLNNPSDLRYNLAMLQAIETKYMSCRSTLVENISRDSTLRLLLEQHAIPMYADLTMMKGQANFQRLKKEQMQIGECKNLRIVFPLNTLRKVIRDKKLKTEIKIPDNEWMTSSQIAEFLRGEKKPNSQQEMVQFIRTLKRLAMVRGGM